MNKFSDGPAKENFQLGQKIKLTVINYAFDNKVMAAGVKTIVPSTNLTPHITIAVDRKAGGKPFHSNQLTNWEPITPIELEGVIEECH